MLELKQNLLNIFFKNTEINMRKTVENLVGHLTNKIISDGLK